MNSGSFSGGLFVVTGVLGFLYWPAWIITGIILITLPDNKTSALDLQRKEDAARPGSNQRSGKPASVSLSVSAREPNIFPAPSMDRTELPEPTEKRTEKYPSERNAQPRLPSVTKPICIDQVPIDATPKTDTTLTSAFAIGGPTTVGIARRVQERRIKQLVHFTRCENIGMILDRGLLSITDLEMERTEAIRNDALRLDGKPGAICLSISSPNHRMFYKYRCENRDTEWAVLRLKPEILWELDCMFYEMNAADHRMRHRARSETQGPNSFSALFGDVGGVRPSRLKLSYPTNAQAEVMVMEPIDPSYILSVGFETQESHRRWSHLTEGVNTTIGRRGKGLFGPREFVLAH